MRIVHDNGVVELDPSDPKATVCGHCKRGWDDSVSTSVTPVPSGRCPFEYDHVYGIVAGPHADHHVTYNERGIVVRDIAQVTDGDIEVDFHSPAEVETITETFLYCETCDLVVTGEDIGASDAWEVRQV